MEMRFASLHSGTYTVIPKRNTLASTSAISLRPLFIANIRFKWNRMNRTFRIAVYSSPISGGGTFMSGSEKVSSSTVDVEDEKMDRVCDKLIEVFLVDKPSSTDWRRLLAFSRDWGRIRSDFFSRCQHRGQIETDFEMKHKILRLARKLKEIDEDVQRHDELIKEVKTLPNENLSDVVSRRRRDFTSEFFTHLFTVAQSYRPNTDEEQALAKLGNKLINAVVAFDNATESIESLNLHEIINSSSKEEAYRKIDDLSSRNQPDTALAMMLAKAWSAAKGTDVTKDEVKDIMYHMYMRAIDHLESQMPKDARIAKHLLKIKDPERRRSALNDAFTPGEESEGRHVDYLYTTPRSLHTWLGSVIEAYHSKKGGPLLREARDLMNPKKIHDLQQLRSQIEQFYF